MSSTSLVELRAAQKEASERFLLGVEAAAPLFAPLAVAAATTAAAAAVHAIGIGRKVVAGRSTAERCVRFFVLQKIASSLLGARSKLPREIGGVPTDVVESPHAVLLAGPPCAPKGQRQIPLRPGVAVSGERTTAGTIGCLVCRRGGDPAPMLLSCSHVLADASSRVGEDVLHPARLDGGTVPSAVVGQLVSFTNCFTPPVVETDAAIARVAAGILVDPSICAIGRPTSVSKPKLHVRVRVRARSSNPGEAPRQGVITDIDLDVWVLDPTTSRRILYRNQARIEPASSVRAFTVGGDSGALVLEAGAPAGVGLVVGGDPGGSFSIITPLRRVLDHLDVELM